MSFRVGSTIIHPHHGAVKIKAKTVRTFNGKESTYLELEVTNGEPRFNPGMKILVVENRMEEIGIREAATPQEAQEVLDILANMKNIRMPTNWSRRFKNHSAMLADGDIFQVATVVRNLYWRNEASAKLSAGERMMQSRAENQLVTELAVTWKVSVEDATKRIKDTLATALKESTQEP